MNSFVYWFKGLFTCRLYLACKMTGRSRKDQVLRARHLCAVFRKAGLDPISPVIEEKVRIRKGALKNLSRLSLHKKWKMDKNIIAWKTHAVVMDDATAKSFGMEREYALNRFLWWKPTILLMERPGLTIADFEDDLISNDEEDIAHYLKEKHGNIYKRWKWRLSMFNRSLPKFIVGHIWQWIH